MSVYMGGGARSTYRRSADEAVSEHREAITVGRAAIADAGLEPALVDGLVTFSQEYVPEIELARALGIGDIRYLARTPYGGGGAAATVQLATLAIEAGIARAVLCYRSTNGFSGPRKGRGDAFKDPAGPSPLELEWHRPLGLRTPVSWAALLIDRYLHESDATETDLGRVVLDSRRSAHSNPHAVFYRRAVPSMDDYLGSPYVATPLRLMDCCLESDGAAAFVVVSKDLVERAPGRRVRVLATAVAAAPRQRHMTNFYDDDILAFPEVRSVADQLWKRSGVAPADVELAIMYDHFSAFVPMQFELYGFCGRGAGAGFMQSAEGSKVRTNPHGGQLSEGYVQGVNGVVEAVAQLSGRSAEGTAPELGLITGGVGIPTSAALFGAE